MTDALIAAPPELGSTRLIPSTRAALAEAETIPDLRKIVDGARLFEEYARKALKSRTAQNEWAELRLDAQRKGGGLLRRMDEAGHRRSKGASYASSSIPEDERPPTLLGLGIAETESAAAHRSHSWQQLALIPDEPWTQWKAEQRGKDKDFSEAAALQFAKRFQEWTERERELFEGLMRGETVVASYRTDENLIEWADSEGLFVRIDRRSDWGNPFLMDDDDGPNDGDRGTVIGRYEEHYLPFKPSLTGRLAELRGKALGCWCAPESCHGDVLKRWAEARMEEQG